LKAKEILISALCFCLAANAKAIDLQVTLRVKDDFGKPVIGAKGGIAIFQYWKPGEAFGEDIYKQIDGVTDANGLIVLKASSRRDTIRYGLDRKAGYYSGSGGEYRFTNKIAGRWQPWNPTIDIVLKPIVNPVPVYARHIKVHFPTPDKDYGYDLMIGDWVAPYGKGQSADFVFRITGYWKSVSDLDSTVTLTFSNPSDGIQPFAAPPPRKGSELRSPREAPLDGYRSTWSWHRARKPGQKSTEQIDDTKDDSNYFFRTRTIMDEQGKIKSALYGKIYEGFKFAGAVTNGYLDSGPCFLNPEPNSRNMEFDPKRNLAKGLKFMEGVSEP
jgi:hypothetical protein